eukprot:260099-Prymnesium_polylepis.1
MPRVMYPFTSSGMYDPHNKSTVPDYGSTGRVTQCCTNRQVWRHSGIKEAFAMELRDQGGIWVRKRTTPTHGARFQ